MNVKIIGNGVWGKALYSVISQNLTNVQIFGRGKININKNDVLILATPSNSIREVLQNVNFSDQEIIIVNSAKGIEKDTHFLPYQIVKSVLGEKVDYYSLMGPSFAEEVENKMPTLVNLGYEKGVNSTLVKNIFQTDFFRVRLTLGVEALEISGAFKNIYAIACGLAKGLGYQTNTRVKLIVLAIEEQNKLFESLGLKLNSDMSAGTIGDLILSCSDEKSRNFTFGKLISEKSVNEAIDLIGATVEGYSSIFSLDYFKNQSKLDLHLAIFVYNAVMRDDPRNIKKYFEEFVKST